MPIYSKCKTCGAVFYTKPSKTKTGRGLYCSRKCTAAKASAPDERFWGKVNKEGSEAPNGLGKCWEWIAGKTDRGYGQFSFGGRADGKNILAHRFSYQLEHGALTSDIAVLHKCDNTSCVNPAHLFTGTQQDNITDKTSKNRQAKGVEIGTSVLTEAQVSEIKRRYSFGRQVLASLAKEFGVSSPTIARIRDEITWSHISLRR